METFAYYASGYKQEVFGLLWRSWSDAAVLGGRTAIISLMKTLLIPKRVVRFAELKEWAA